MNVGVAAGVVVDLSGYSGAKPDEGTDNDDEESEEVVFVGDVKVPHYCIARWFPTGSLTYFCTRVPYYRRTSSRAQTCSRDCAHSCC